jgi:hypothetical protein
MWTRDQSAEQAADQAKADRQNLAQCLANPQPTKHLPMFWEGDRLPDVLPRMPWESGRL